MTSSYIYFFFHLVSIRTIKNKKNKTANFVRLSWFDTLIRIPFISIHAKWEKNRADVNLSTCPHHREQEDKRKHQIPVPFRHWSLYQHYRHCRRLQQRQDCNEEHTLELKLAMIPGKDLSVEQWENSEPDAHGIVSLLSALLDSKPDLPCLRSIEPRAWVGTIFDSCPFLFCQNK